MCSYIDNCLVGSRGVWHASDFRAAAACPECGAVLILKGPSPIENIESQHRSTWNELDLV